MDKTLLALLFASLFLALSPALNAQDQPPLKWGIDEEGGVPYFFGAPDNPKAFIGFEVELIDALSAELKRLIEREHADFENLLQNLDRGDFDFAMNGLEISPENLKKARFTRPYYIYQLQLVCRADDHRFTTLKECKDQGLVVGTLSGSAAAKVLKDHLDDGAIKLFDKQDNVFNKLMDGTLDGVLVDVPIALYYVVPDDQIKHRKEKYAGKLKLVGQPFAEGFYGIAIKKGNEALHKEIDDALGRLIQNGKVKEILTRWHLWSPDQYRLYAPIRLPEASQTAPPVLEFLLLLLKGAGMTVLLTIGGMAVAVALGLPIALARLYGPLPVRWLAIAYVEFFRGIPVLLLLYFMYFSLPTLIGVKLDAHVVAILGFGLNYAAYEAEIYRNGIQAIPIGQWEAGASLGMSPFLTFRRIIFPQSIRVILPPMTNDFIALFKDTSLVSVIAVIELTKQYQILTNSYDQHLVIGAMTAVLYLVMSVPLGYLSRHLEQRWGKV
ncbi:MAG: ABC transporter permease subunit [Planctomycetes bacterium]|nr:ABC transporter permease subunit [Planctomycetota bacterium]